MKLLRALLLLLESIMCLTALSVQEKIRKVKSRMKKQKDLSSQPPSPSPSQAPSLKLRPSSKGRPCPPFPDQKTKSPKDQDAKDSRTTISSSGLGGELEVVSERDKRTCAAVLDIPFRGAHLIWADVQPLTKEELEYLAEPLAEILIELDWMEKIKGPYIKLGYGLSVAIVTRVRAHEKVKAEKKKAAEVEGRGKAEVEAKKPGGAMEQGRT